MKTHIFYLLQKVWCRYIGKDQEVDYYPTDPELNKILWSVQKDFAP